MSVRGDEIPGASARPTWWKRLGFVAVNAWLCYHLFAIVIGPASVPPAPPLVQSGWRLASGYLQALYLNHGFHFFSPDPSGSTLVQYTLEFPDGRTETGRLPNRRISPRLLYHRHFMVTEFLGNGPEEFRPLVERALARNLIRTTGAESVQLELVYHDTAGVEDILAGQSLNEPALFTVTELGRYALPELQSPYEPPVIAPAPTELADNDSLEETPWEESAVPAAEEDVPLTTAKTENR